MSPGARGVGDHGGVGELPSYLERFRLDGRLAIVTGGGAGLGRVFCLALGEAGAEVVVADLDPVAAEETVALVRGRGGAARPVTVDVADPGAVEALAAHVGRTGRHPAVLVNNAGVSTRSQLVHQTPVEEWDRVVAINLRGTFLVSRALLPLMIDGGGGSVVNLASIVGLEALHPAILAQASYVAAKAGVIGLTRQMAVEYAPHGIRVNAIAPGWHFGTRLGEKVGNFPTDADVRRLQDFVADHTPLARAGTPDELAGLLLYLASDASSYVTGQIVAHDGGWTAW